MQAKTPVESFVAAPNGRIWTACFNSSAPGTPLLVLHGGPGFLSMPQVVSDLADERPVVFYDQLGCGRSDRPADLSFASVVHYVSELAAVRDALDLPHCHLLAHSWGAMLAAEYVLRRRPAGIRGLVLCGPLLSTPLWERDQRRHLSRMPPRVRQAVAVAEECGRFETESYQNAMMEFYRAHVCRLDPWPDALNQALAQLNPDVYLSMWGPSEFTVTGSLKGADLLPRLREIDVPTLLVGGEHDEAAPDTLLAFRNALPRGEMAVLPRASHLHHLERPDLFLPIVRDFLRRADPSV